MAFAKYEFPQVSSPLTTDERGIATISHPEVGDLDSKLDSYAALARTFPPGSPVRLAYQLGREYGLTQRLMDRIIERVNVLPEDATLYDIQQVFTELANGSVNYKTMIKLQGLSGELAFNTEQVTHRCGTCERLLPGD